MYIENGIVMSLRVFIYGGNPEENYMLEYKTYTGSELDSLPINVGYVITGYWSVNDQVVAVATEHFYHSPSERYPSITKVIEDSPAGFSPAWDIGTPLGNLNSLRVIKAWNQAEANTTAWVEVLVLGGYISDPNVVVTLLGKSLIPFPGKINNRRWERLSIFDLEGYQLIELLGLRFTNLLSKTEFKVRNEDGEDSIEQVTSVLVKRCFTVFKDLLDLNLDLDLAKELDLNRVKTWDKIYETVYKVYNRFRPKRELPISPLLRKIDGKVVYTEDQPVERYTLVVPKSSVDLIDWGDILQHCVGTYVDAVIAGATSIIGVYKSKNIMYTLETREQKCLQFFGVKNSSVPDKVVKAVLEKLHEAEIIAQSEISRGVLDHGDLNDEDNNNVIEDWELENWELEDPVN